MRKLGQHPVLPSPQRSGGIAPGYFIDPLRGSGAEPQEVSSERKDIPKPGEGKAAWQCLSLKWHGHLGHDITLQQARVTSS